MSDFIQPSKRSIELPLGCKDLIDVESIREWREPGRPGWIGPTMEDKLAYAEGYLTRLLQQASPFPLISISRHEQKGCILIVKNAGLTAPIIFASWNSAEQGETVRSAFEETSATPAAGPVGRWRVRHSFKYTLPLAPPTMARIIGEIFRGGYGLDHLAPIAVWYREQATDPPLGRPE